MSLNYHLPAEAKVKRIAIKKATIGIRISSSADNPINREAASTKP